MEWKSVEEKPPKSQIYLVMGFCNMFYFARYNKRRNFWCDFTHFIGRITPRNFPNWPIHVRAWCDLNDKKIKQKLTIKASNDLPQNT